jgi:hypothetical protein
MKVGTCGVNRSSAMPNHGTFALLAVDPPWKPTPKRLHPIGAWKVWPADHHGGPLFLSPRNRKPARGLRDRGKP